MKKIINNNRVRRIFLNLSVAISLSILLNACGAGPSNEQAMRVMDNIELTDELATENNFNTEEYNRVYENEFVNTTQNPLSTFSIDVDKASYSNIRRYLDGGHLPPKDAVRIEEMVNYFSYDYPNPEGEHPFSIYTETAVCPWNKEHRLVHIGLQGKKVDYENLKPSNLVFLIDVSGSMDEPNKLPLVKESLNMMLDNLQTQDKVALVVYAESSEVVLESTSMEKKNKIKKAIRLLTAGGSTAGGQGLQMAYEIAKENYITNGNNRVILCTDGDFNVGVSSTSELVRLIEEKRKDDIYLTICGFGMGNYKDGRLEQISNAGNGNYFYIDQEDEAEKVFVKELRANLFTIAKDVKIQVEFNPQKVQSYRLIGYENRMLKSEDFNNDKKDAGELGAGHTVTALYEIVPVGSPSNAGSVDPLKYQQTSDKAQTNEMMTIKFRYKPIGSNESKLIVHPVIDNATELDKTSENFRFSAAVAGFGMLLRESEHKGNATYQSILKLAENAVPDNDKDRFEFIGLVKKAKALAN